MLKKDLSALALEGARWIAEHTRLNTHQVETVGKLGRLIGALHKTKSLGFVDYDVDADTYTVILDFDGEISTTELDTLLKAHALPRRYKLEGDVQAKEDVATLVVRGRGEYGINLEAKFKGVYKNF